MLGTELTVLTHSWIIPYSYNRNPERQYSQSSTITRNGKNKDKIFKILRIIHPKKQRTIESLKKLNCLSIVCRESVIIIASQRLSKSA